MKKLIEVTEVEGEGLDALLGEQVLLFGLNYVYAGKLVGVNSVFVKLEDAKIVYATGPFNNRAEYQDAQNLPNKEWYIHSLQSNLNLPNKEWYIQLSAIESYGKGKS